MIADLEIQSLMTLCPHSIGFDQDIEVAEQMMNKYKIHHLPVQEGGRLMGIISDRDVKHAIGWNKTANLSLSVRDVYIPDPYIIEPTTKLSTVLRRMVEDRIGCVIVAVPFDKLVGIFTITDACRYLSDLITGTANKQIIGSGVAK